MGECPCLSQLQDESSSKMRIPASQGSRRKSIQKIRSEPTISSFQQARAGTHTHTQSIGKSPWETWLLQLQLLKSCCKRDTGQKHSLHQQACINNLAINNHVTKEACKGQLCSHWDTGNISAVASFSTSKSETLLPCRTCHPQRNRTRLMCEI